MSNVYNIEPPTQGKVLLRTTKGEIEIELWAKEAPKAVRNFVQLCLEGFYDKTIFHRILKGELAQGGDPTGTGDHSNSIYGQPFKDELHSRLRFNHRGLVACAGQQRPHTNGSQFFITLDATPWLDKKHTIFGKVTGDTIFNATALGELETDEHDRPIDIPSIKSTEVIWNPFEDIVPRTTPAQREAAEAEAAARAKAETKKKAKKNLSLISFEDEEGTTAEEAALPRIRSAHDTVQDRRLVQENTETAAELARREELEAAERRRKQQAVRSALSKRVEEAQPAAEREASGNVGLDADLSEQGEDDFEARMRAAAIAKRKAFGKPEAQSPEKTAAGPPSDGEGDSEDEARPGKAARISLRPASKAATGKLKLKVPDAELMSDSQRKFKEARLRNRQTKANDASNLERLKAFRATLSAGAQPKPADTAQAPADVSEAEPQAAWRIEDYLAADDEVDVMDLRGHKLNFSKSGTSNSMSRNEQIDDYVVIDPRVAAQKQKLSKGQLKSVQQAKEEQWQRRGPVG